MNGVLNFLESNRERLALDRYGVGKPISWLMVTPRFRASRHVVFLILDRATSEPALVVKVPRLSGHNRQVEREAANLRSAGAVYAEGIPQVIACEPYGDRTILVETALQGEPMGPTMVRRRPAECCRRMLHWLRGGEIVQNSDDWFERLIEQPLEQFASRFPLTAKEQRCLRATREVIEPLRGSGIPLVLEHGDLSHPNLLMLPDGQIGVIDWELAQPRGLPAQDLFFFLTYVALARAKADTWKAQAGAFDAAFFGPEPWASPYIADYARAFDLPGGILPALFIACWVRRVAGLVNRLDGESDGCDTLSVETAAWIRQDRYYRLWNHALGRVGEMAWDETTLQTMGSM